MAKSLQLRSGPLQVHGAVGWGAGAGDSALTVIERVAVADAPSLSTIVSLAVNVVVVDVV